MMILIFALAKAQFEAAKQLLVACRDYSDQWDRAYHMLGLKTNLRKEIDVDDIENPLLHKHRMQAFGDKIKRLARFKMQMNRLDCEGFFGVSGCRKIMKIQTAESCPQDLELLLKRFPNIKKSIAAKQNKALHKLVLSLYAFQSQDNFKLSAQRYFSSLAYVSFYSLKGNMLLSSAAGYPSPIFNQKWKFDHLPSFFTQTEAILLKITSKIWRKKTNFYKKKFLGFLKHAKIICRHVRKNTNFESLLAKLCQRPETMSWVLFKHGSLNESQVFESNLIRNQFITIFNNLESLKRFYHYAKAM